jgi:hypothetical protein
VDLLESLLRRELTSSEWNHISIVLSSMSDAIDSADASGFVTAVDDLEVLALEPATRTGRLAAPIPEAVRETASALLHTLTPMLPDASEHPRESVAAAED